MTTPLSGDDLAAFSAWVHAQDHMEPMDPATVDPLEDSLTIKNIRAILSDLTAARAEIEQLNALLKNARSGAQAWIKAHDTIDAALQAAQSEVSALKEEVEQLSNTLTACRKMLDSTGQGLAEATRRNASLQSLIAEKDAALEPFAAESEGWGHVTDPNFQFSSVRFGPVALHHARTALNSTEAKTGGGA